MVVRAVEPGLVVEPASIDWLQEGVVAQSIVGSVMGMGRCSGEAGAMGSDCMVPLEGRRQLSIL